MTARRSLSPTRRLAIRERADDGWRFTCDECQAVFTVKYNMNAHRVGKPKFCSQECYAVTRARRARERLRDRFWSLVEMRGPSECWPWKGHRRPLGYGWFHIHRRKSANASRVAYALTNGEVPAGLLVCHSCDNPPCCNPNHLWLGTDADNAKDRDAKGRSRQGAPRRGELSGQAKLTAEAVREIVSSGDSDTVLAARHGVTAAAIYNVRHGKSWGHITGISRHAP